MGANYNGEKRTHCIRVCRREVDQLSLVEVRPKVVFDASCVRAPARILPRIFKPTVAINSVSQILEYGGEFAIRCSVVMGLKTVHAVTNVRFLWRRPGTETRQSLPAMRTVDVPGDATTFSEPQIA